MLKKKIWTSFQRSAELFTQKFVTKLQKYGVEIRDSGSEIRDPEKTYSESQIPGPGPGAKKAPDPGSGSATLSARVANEFSSAAILETLHHQNIKI
jgi:hypothetical protein